MTSPRVALRVRPGTLGRRLARELLPDPDRVALDAREVAIRLVEPAVAVPTLARRRLGDESWELLGLPEPAWIPAASLERPEPGLVVVREPSPCLGSTSIEVSHPVPLDSYALFVELRAEPAAALVRQLGPDARPVGGAIAVDRADIVECVVLDGDPERLPASSPPLDHLTLDAFLRRLLGLSTGSELVPTARDLLDRRPTFPRQRAQDPPTEPEHIARPAAPPRPSTAAAQAPAISFTAAPDAPHGASAPTGGGASPVHATVALIHGRLDSPTAPAHAPTAAVVGDEVKSAASHLPPPPAASLANVHTHTAALDTADEPMIEATPAPTPSKPPPFRSPDPVFERPPVPERSPSMLAEFGESTRSAPDLRRPADDRAALAAQTAANVVTDVSLDMTARSYPQPTQRRTEPAVAQAGSPDLETSSQPSTAARSAPAAPSAPPRAVGPDVTPGIDAIAPIQQFTSTSQKTNAVASSSQSLPRGDAPAAASSPSPTLRSLSRIFSEPRTTRPAVDYDDDSGAKSRRARLLCALASSPAQTARLRPSHDRMIDRIEVDLRTELERIESAQGPPGAATHDDRQPAAVGGLLQMIPRSPRFGGLL